MQALSSFERANSRLPVVAFAVMASSASFHEGREQATATVSDQ